MSIRHLGLDHVGVAVPDLEAGRAAYARLGFRLTPRSLHSGSLTPGGPVQPWGSGNHCAMFERGYLEIIGLTDRALPSSVKDLVARHTGLHILAIRCADAERTHDALAAAGAPVESIRALERDAAYGEAGDQVRRARFRNLYVDRKAYPEARILFIEHDTPDVLWQPHLLSHPNGVVGLESMVFASNDPSSLASRLAALLQCTADGPQDDAEIALGRGTIKVLSCGRWKAWVGEPATVPLPAPVGAVFRVAHLADTRACLQAAGVGVRPAVDAAGREGLLVPAQQACGASLLFFE